MATKTKFVVRYTKSWPTKSSKMERAPSWPKKLGDYVTRQIFVRWFCWQIKSADFVVRLTSP